MTKFNHDTNKPKQQQQYYYKTNKRNKLMT